MIGSIQDFPKPSYIVRHIAQAQLRNVAHFAYDVVFASTKCALQRATDRFLKKTPQSDKLTHFSLIMHEIDKIVTAAPILPQIGTHTSHSMRITKIQKFLTIDIFLINYS